MMVFLKKELVMMDYMGVPKNPGIMASAALVALGALLICFHCHVINFSSHRACYTAVIAVLVFAFVTFTALLQR